MAIEQRTFLRSASGEIFKYVFANSELAGDFETSSFFISDLNRHDLCVSCMAGCPMGCTMCATTYSAHPFERNLTSDEILAQVVTAIHDRADLSNANTELRIGFMGNGDALSNFEAVQAAIRKICRLKAVRVGNFILSTIGVARMQRVYRLLELSRETGIPIKLQYSLFSMDETVRKTLISKARPLQHALPHLDAYAAASGIPVRYNVPLIAGVNDSQEHFKALIAFFLEKPDLRRLKLSVYNPFPGSPFAACPDEKITSTGAWLEQNGVCVDLFFGNRDDALMASCGQMRASH